MRQEAHGRAVLDLARLWQVKHRDDAVAAALGSELVSFFTESVQRRQNKLCQLAEKWALLIPEALSEHCSLESFSRGVLLVLVDTAPHLYEMKQLLLAGLQEQLLLACRSVGLRKIMLRQGRWYKNASEPDCRNVQFPPWRSNSRRIPRNRR